MICKIVYFSLLLGCAFSRPDGAPIGACGDMTPRHPENTPSDLANNPYQVSANMSVNGKISVSVSGPNFRGILLQARTSKNGMPMGTWILPAGGNYQLLNCGSLPSSALTHTNNQTKTNQVFYWNPPDVSSATNFTVFATIVQVFSTFYVKVPTNQITIQPEASFGSGYTAINSQSSMMTSAKTATLPMANGPEMTTSNSNLIVPSYCVWIMLLAGISLS